MQDGADVFEWRNQKRRHEKLGKQLFGVVAIPLIGLTAFIIKFSNLSVINSMSVTELLFWMGILVASGFIGVPAILYHQVQWTKSKKRLAEMQSALVSEFRHNLTQAPDGERAKIESLLREMGM